MGVGSETVSSVMVWGGTVVGETGGEFFPLNKMSPPKETKVSPDIDRSGTNLTMGEGLVWETRG